MDKRTGILIAVLIIAAIGGYFLFGQSENTEAEPVNSNTASKQISDGSDTSSTPEEIDGEAYTIVEGDIAYLAQKEFFSKPTSEVEGHTSDVTGTVVLNEEEQTVSVDATIETTFETDSTTRDNDVRKLLGETLTISASDIAVPASFFEVGETVELKTPLTVTIQDERVEVPFELSARMKDGQLQAHGSGSLTFTQFNLEAPSLVNVYTVADKLEVAFEIAATPKQ